MTKKAMKLAVEAITQYLAESPTPSEEAVEGLCDARAILRKALAEQPAQQDSTCSNALRAQGKAYPRTCKKCGLGPCVELAQQALDKMAENALEQPAQKCSYPYCGCNSKAWCKVERNEALDKKAENARELGLDYEPDIPFGDNNPGLPWDEVPQAFNDWWNADYDPTGNPFEKDTHAYWAWAGWKAAEQPAQPMHPEIKKMYEDYFDKCFRESSPAVPENFMDALKFDVAMRDVDAMVAVARADEREVCAMRAWSSVFAMTDAETADKVLAVIRARSNT